MCGRFTHLFTWADVHRLLSLSTAAGPGPTPSYNVAPTQVAPVVREEGGQRVPGRGRFGFVPAWAADGGVPAGLTTINARAETAAEKPLYKGALARSRCVVPVSGFYEWQRAEREGGAKVPWYVTRADGGVMLLAGLWSTGGKERAENDGAERGCDGSFALVTCASNAFMGRLHDRMPVVLEPEDAPAWLNEQRAEVVGRLMRPARDGVLGGHAVSRRVNSARQNDAGLIEPDRTEGGSTTGDGVGNRGRSAEGLREDIKRRDFKRPDGQMGLFG